MICIINCGSTKTPEFIKIFDNLNIDAEIIDMNNINKMDISKYKAYIISGAPILLTKVNQNDYIRKFDFIKNIDVPVLGVCFGHQIIGLLYGANCFIGDEVRYEHEINVQNKNILFENINDNLFVEDHCEYITLPDDFVLLANSVNCINEAMKHPIKEIYSVQFHPEVSGNNGIQLLKNFIYSIKDFEDTKI